MIYVTKSQLQQVEYLIRQSIQGHHVLFDAEHLRRALAHEDSRKKRSAKPMTEAEAAEVERHIETLIAQSTLQEKRAYLQDLQESDSRKFAWVVKAYFSIIESNLLESQEVLH